MTSQLDLLIPGEISNDSFYRSILNFAKLTEVNNILEIGSSSGAGSTQAFVEAIQARTDRSSVSLFCIELSNERLLKLKETYRDYDFVKAYNVSSVSTREFPSITDTVLFFIRNNFRIEKKIH